MSLRHGLRGLARNVLSSKALPERAGAGAPVKLSPKPDKPLPKWYEMWWENGIYPGQPAADFMFGPLPANVTERWYAKAWAMFAVAMGIPIWYTYTYLDEYRHPMVPQQYPPEVREVLLRSRNNSLVFDYSSPDYEANKGRRQNFWTTFA